MFRSDFAWGVAASAYQVEGRMPDDGAGRMIWDKFIEEGHIIGSYGAEKTCMHMKYYKEDYKLMKMLGIKAYRFSVSWARIMPNGIGEVNEKAIALYRDMILSMKEEGITPYLTLYHWELPQALQDKGGWLNPQIVEWFGEYAKVVAENFSDICEYFITLNEPQCFVGLGYLSGVHAPGLKSPYKDTFRIGRLLSTCVNMQRDLFWLAMLLLAVWHTLLQISRRTLLLQKNIILHKIIQWITGHGMLHGLVTLCSLDTILQMDLKSTKSGFLKLRRRIWS